MRFRTGLAPFTVALTLLPIAAAQTPRFFAGAGPGIAILSAASGTAISADRAALSNYAPKLGLMGHVFFGWHANEYLSLQGAWSYQTNDLTLSATASNGAFYQQRRDSRQHNGGGEVLLYFRNRRSFVRPFLSAGLGLQRIASDAAATLTQQGSIALPPAAFTATEPGLRVAAGADLLLGKGWGLRYAFLETLQRNPIGRRLTPSAGSPLMNFHHVFGFVKYF